MSFFIGLVLVCSVVAFIDITNDNKIYHNVPIIGLMAMIVGFPGYLIGTIVEKQNAKRIHEEFQKRERKEYETKYGGMRADIQASIISSPKIDQFAARIIQEKPLPEKVSVRVDGLYFQGNEIRFADYGLANVPWDCVETLARTLANSERLNGMYQYWKDPSDYTTFINTYYIVLKQEYRDKVIFNW